MLLDRRRIGRPNPTIPVLPATLVVKALWSQNPVDLNASTSVASGTVRDETIPVSTPTASAPRRKRSGSTSLEPDAPPKRLKLGPLKGWGVERDGVNISAAEFAQKHWSEFQDEYPEMLPSILVDDV
ncbi:hypothetical protein C8R44DRAFT_987708 [Mycena epipterygia]|nr:hypothetical protein C8R44DRAFT_987708 [Mycena epipterygia]